MKEGKKKKGKKGNTFADTVSAKFPMYIVRGMGGLLYVAGALIMAWNIYMTIRRSEPAAKAANPSAVPAE